MGFLLTLLITGILIERTDKFFVTKHQETKGIKTLRTKDNKHFKNTCCSICQNLIENKYNIMEYVLSHQMRFELLRVKL